MCEQIHALGCTPVFGCAENIIGLIQHNPLGERFWWHSKLVVLHGNVVPRVTQFGLQLGLHSNINCLFQCLFLLACLCTGSADSALRKGQRIQAVEMMCCSQRFPDAQRAARRAPVSFCSCFENVLAVSFSPATKNTAMQNFQSSVGPNKNTSITDAA